MADDRTTITQDEGDRFALDHSGVALFGDDTAPAMRHDLGAAVVHRTSADCPLVHMVCWDEEPCEVKVSGRLELAGDPEAPIDVRMRHEFPGDHHQTHAVDPLDHSLRVQTGLAAPLHHALQMRTPVQLRFCNPWHIASDYKLEVNLGNNRVISIRLSGATVATPQPCEDDGCPPADREPPG